MKLAMKVTSVPSKLEKKPVAKAIKKKKKVVSESVLRMKKARSQVNRLTLRGALLSDLKTSSGRDDINLGRQNQVASSTQNDVPIEMRAGFPLKIQKGAVHPKDWVTRTGGKLSVDFARSSWLPDDWGQALKMTKPTSHSTGGNGGILTTYVAPDGKTCFFHKKNSMEYAGRTLTDEDGKNGQIRLAKLQAEHQVNLARGLCKDLSGKSSTTKIGSDSDGSFFKLLTPHERKCLAPKSEFHFAVVSARRATKIEGIKDICMVQMQFKEAGVEPTWYVDAESLQSYRALGLKAVVGGKLTAARNLAIKDARKQRKVCVQCSDDISAWEYRDGKKAASRNDDLQNAAWNAAKRYIVSPVAAAQFILAKMRGAEGPKPRLGGPYIVDSCARTFSGDEFSRKHFILGDFSVVDVSDVLYDENMNLKEDYDFACSHIHKYGSVMRCNRMTLSVKHYANSGGAVTNRDSKGQEERRNIEILLKKWPGIFRPNPKRKSEVIMRWRNTCDEDGVDGKVSRSKKSSSTKKGGVIKSISKKSPTFAPDFPAEACLVYTGKESSACITKRCRKAAGMTIAKALTSLRYIDTKGATRPYTKADLRYDLARGTLSLCKKKAGLGK